ncbi:hypothetical protein DFH09DRAFT_1107146 [Mycena vulgaris]|nr:hypothetical protein DFH09DRAFT_1107146 [Mycena vulgaris]
MTDEAPALRWPGTSQIVGAFGRGEIWRWMILRKIRRHSGRQGEDLTFHRFGWSNTYPLTLPAARRLLHSLVVVERPLADVLTAATLYTLHGLPPAHDDLSSCALLLAACLRHLKTVGAEGKEQADVTAAVGELLAALRARLASAEPMPHAQQPRHPRQDVSAWEGPAVGPAGGMDGAEQVYTESQLRRSRFNENLDSTDVDFWCNEAKV